MALFRYKGVVLEGEREDQDGMMVPNVLDSVDLYGFTFHKRRFTEVPDDAVAISGRTLDRDQGKLVPYKVTVVEKLRNNNHFEEKAAVEAA